MTSTTILTVLLVFSFIIGRFLRRFDTPHFIFSGMLYVLLGLLFGSSMGVGILSEDLLYKLEPMTDLMTGLAGFLLGLRFKRLMQYKRSFVGGTLLGIATFIAMTVAIFLVAPYAIDFTAMNLNLNYYQLRGLEGLASHFSIPMEVNRNQLWFAVGTSATACSASLLSLGMVSKFNKTTTEISRGLSIFAPSLQFVAISLLGFCLAMARADLSATELNISLGEWIIASMFSGFICGILFSLFIGRQSNQNRIMLAALGAIIFAAGIGAILNVSSLFVCFLTGLTISVFSSYAEVLKENLVRVEEPIFVMLLIIGGASWNPEINRAWLLPAVYFLVRALVFSGLAQPIHRKLTRRKLTRLGQGLLGQDLIAVAIALSLAKEFPDLAQLFLTTILGSIFLNDFVANSLLKKVILDNEQVVNVSPLVTEEGTK